MNSRYWRFPWLVQRSRPALWMATLVPCAAALYIANAPLNALNVGMLAFLSFPFNLYLYGLNDCCDRETDLASGRGKGVDSRHLTREDAYFLLEAIALVNLPFLVVILVLLGDAFHIMLFLIVFLIVPWAYSAQPVRLKGRPFLDGLASTFYLASFSFPLYANGCSPFQYKGVLPTLFFLVGTHTVGAVRDVSADRRAGVTTTGVLLGPRLASLYAGSVFLAGLVVAATRYPYNLLLGACTLLALHLARRPTEHLAAKTFHWLLVAFVAFLILWGLSSPRIG